VMWILPSYQRASKNNWIESDEIVGYDLQCAIQDALRENGLQDFSLAEVMLACGHPGVGLACVFLSHVQQETVQFTLKACKNYACKTWKLAEPFFWLDYFTLRQCQKDFNLNKVFDIIKRIGNTVLVAEALHAVPLAVTRTFCVYEVYSTVANHDGHRSKRLSVIAVNEPTGRDLCTRLTKSGLKVDLAAASCRSEEDKQQIDQLILNSIGFERANDLCTQALDIAFRNWGRSVFCHFFQWVLGLMLSSFCCFVIIVINLLLLVSTLQVLLDGQTNTTATTTVVGLTVLP